MAIPKKFDSTKTVEDGYRPIYIGYKLTMVSLDHNVGNMKALEGFCTANSLPSSRIAKLQGGYYVLNDIEQWERISRTLGFLTFGNLYDKLKNLKEERTRENYIVVQGDNIIGCADKLKKAREIFTELPEPQRPSQKRAIYKLIKEDN